MGQGKVLLRESATLQQRHRQGVTHGERRGGARRGSEVERARLLRDAGMQVDRRGLGHGRFGPSRQRDQRNAQSGDQGQDENNLRRLAGVRYREHHVVCGDHAQVTVTRLAGMNEEGRASGTRQGRSDLAGDMAGLAHAGDDDASLAVQAKRAGLDEIGAERALEVMDRGGLDFQHFACSLDDPFRY